MNQYTDHNGRTIYRGSCHHCHGDSFTYEQIDGDTYRICQSCNTEAPTVPLTNSMLVNSPAWLAIHERDHIYRVSITRPQCNAAGTRTREYVWRVPNEQTMRDTADQLRNDPHATITYERIG